LRFDILGGEPLINPAIFEFIDWLSEQPYAKQTTVALTTNGTTYTDKLTKYLDKFLRVGVQLSIDGIGEEFEYLRYGSSFENLEQVSDRFYELKTKYSNFGIGAHYTLSWMNCLTFAEYFNWSQSRYPELEIYVSKLQSPDHYSIELLSLEMRTKIFDETMKKINTPINAQYEKALFLYKEHMLSTTYDVYNEKLLQHGMSTLNVIDYRRNADHRKIIKNFVNFLSLSKKNAWFNYVTSTEPIIWENMDVR
jgi:MoaA/NifB/PqqE/SkfB family radical SAM enzyme